MLVEHHSHHGAKEALLVSDDWRALMQSVAISPLPGTMEAN